MTYEEAYIKVCEGYKKGKSIDSLIKKYLYTLVPEEEYPRLNFDMWLYWACAESHDDYSNPILILCMAEFMKEELQDNPRYGIFLNQPAAAAFAVIDTINWFSLGDNTPPTNIIGSAVRYLFNEEDINTIISDACAPMFVSMISELPDCGVEYLPRHELQRFFANEEMKYLEQCGINTGCPF